jgi:hypothetical protein
METKEIAVLEKQVLPLVAQAQAQQITSREDMKTATTVLSELGRYYDTVVAKREEITTPMNLALKNARAMFDPIEKPAKAAMQTLRTRMAEYQTAQTEAAEQAAEKLAARIQPGKGHLTMETAMRKADAIAKPDEVISTESGQLKFRKQPTLEITDLDLIPAEYWLVDEAKLFQALKDGNEVLGAKIGYKMVPINTR